MPHSRMLAREMAEKMARESGERPAQSTQLYCVRARVVLRHVNYIVRYSWRK